jgi:hypothetical protein
MDFTVGTGISGEQGKSVAGEKAAEEMVNTDPCRSINAPLPPASIPDESASDVLQYPDEQVGDRQRDNAIYEKAP